MTTSAAPHDDPASGDQPLTPRWAERGYHRRWLLAECDRLLDFAEAAAHPDGGFAWLDASGQPLLDRPVQTWITCRMTHVFSLAHLLGRPGAGRLADHGIAALSGMLRDAENAGWYAGAGPDQQGKEAYAHAFVILAGSSAAAAGRPGARELLTEALEVMESRFWRDDEQMCADVWDRAWSELEDYRGANANMHTVEAFLAAADVTGESRWRERALAILERLVHGFARGNDWRLPEHFDSRWGRRLDYNRDEPDHPFRPYGVTIGHLLEWSRLALHTRAALGEQAPGWLLEDAAALFDRAVSDGWDVDGAEGFVYTTDWDGTPVVRDRLHWVVTEGIAAAAALSAATGRPDYEQWYRTWWDHAATYFLDRDRGSWHHQLDPDNVPSQTVWEGKPDVYHAVQATLIPLLPLSVSLATALRNGEAAAS
jgi:sulfoquinovose isomerase